METRGGEKEDTPAIIEKLKREDDTRYVSAAPDQMLDLTLDLSCVSVLTPEHYYHSNMNLMQESLLIC